jgi:hypothetical protein
MSSAFYVSANPRIPGGSMAMLVNPLESTIHQAVIAQPVVQIVDAFGNLLDGSVVNVSLLVAPSSASTRVSLLWPKWSEELAGFEPSGINYGYRQNLISGNLSVISRNGVVSYTDLRVKVAMKQAILLFTSDNGLLLASAPFVVDTGPLDSMRIRQQPSVWEAGRLMAFEIGLLDADLFVVEAATGAVMIELVQQLTNASAAIQCPSDGKSCLKSFPVKGFATFNFSVSAAVAPLRIRFLTTLSNNALSGGSDDQSENITIMSSPFAILHSSPASIVLSGPSSQTRSLEPFSISAELSDAFGNLFSQSPDVSVSPDYIQGCDSILLQTVCDMPVCLQFQAGCCTLEKFPPGNNLLGCNISKSVVQTTPGNMTANMSSGNTSQSEAVTTIAHFFSIQIGLQNSSKPVLRALPADNSGFQLSLLLNSTPAVLDGISLASSSDGIVQFKDLAIGRAGQFFLKVAMAKLISNTQSFFIGKLQLL